MALFASLTIDAKTMSAREIAIAIGIEITDYVDSCFPEVGVSFKEIVDMLSDCPEGDLGDQMAQALFAKEDGEVTPLRKFPASFYLPALCIAYSHDAIVADYRGDQVKSWSSLANASYWLGLSKGGGVYDDIARNVKAAEARRKANQLHDRPGGSRDKKKAIQKIWASGKYSARDICAEQECAALGMSFSSARKALRRTPDPT